MQKYDSAPIMSILPIGYGNRMDAIGAPGWDRTIRVIDMGFTDPPATFYGLPTHILRSKVPQTLSLNRRNSG